MRYFAMIFPVAVWLPLVEGPARWVVLGLFMGLVCLMLREIGNS